MKDPIVKFANAVAKSIKKHAKKLGMRPECVMFNVVMDDRSVVKGHVHAEEDLVQVTLDASDEARPQ